MELINKNPLPKLSKDLNEKEAWMKWANFHRLLFGWRSETDGQMITSWIGLFRKVGFTPCEMMAATEKVAAQEIAPFNHEQHLNALEQHARIIRNANLKHKLTTSTSSLILCSDCNNFGLVSVPQLSEVVDGVWIGNRTVGVWCSCKEGWRFMNNRDHLDRPMMGSREYFTKNPTWRDQIKKRKELEIERAILWEDIRLQNGLAPPSKLDQILLRLVKQFGLFEVKKTKRA